LFLYKPNAKNQLITKKNKKNERTPITASKTTSHGAGTAAIQTKTQKQQSERHQQPLCNYQHSSCTVVCRSHHCIKRLAEKKRALKHTVSKKLYMSASFLQLPRSKSAPEDKRSKSDLRSGTTKFSVGKKKKQNKKLKPKCSTRFQGNYLTWSEDLADAKPEQKSHDKRGKYQMDLERAGGGREEGRDDEDGHRQRAPKGGCAIPR
jgi:hypothetical protein